MPVPQEYQQWFDEQSAKAAQHPLYGLPLRIQQMHRMYGATEGQVCKHCAHLVHADPYVRIYKCDQSKMSASAATDWRQKWPACGKFIAAVKP